jgi:hypothetical protein
VTEDINHNKESKMKRFTITLLSLGMFIVGCDQFGNNETGSSTEEELLALINADEAFTFDGLDDEGDEEGDYTEGIEVDAGFRMMGDTLLPGDNVKLRFGRKIDREASTRDVTFEVNGDTAVGTVALSLVGTFYVKSIEWGEDSTTSSGYSITNIDTFSKDFTSEFNRKVRFIQVADANNPDGYHWKIDALTMGMGSSGTKLSITNIAFYNNADSTGEAVLSYAADTAGDIYFSRDSLPSFTYNWGSQTTYRVEVTVSNADPILILNDQDSGEKVSMHYGVSRRFKARRGMSDAGTFGDVTASDNVFTRLWRPHRIRFGSHSMIARMFFSAVDNNTLFVSDGGYNTSIWTFPYQVTSN